MRGARRRRRRTRPAAPPASRASERSTFQFEVHFAATAAPIATKPIWPSEICPAHPVRTTSDRPMMAYTPTADALMIWSVSQQHGDGDQPGEDHDADADAHQANER